MQKTPEESLQQRVERLEQEYQAVLDAAVDSVLIIDQHGSIQLVNHAAERMFGYKEEELLGRNVNVLMPQPYRREHDGYLERYLRTREPRIIGTGREVVAQRRDGSTLSVDLAVGLIKGTEPPRFVGFIRDITTRKEAQEALARSEHELNAAQTMANLGNYVIHRNGGGANYRSPQFWRILGLEPNNDIADERVALDQYLSTVVDPADRGRVSAALRAFDEGENSMDIVYRIHRPDGSLRHVHHIAQVVRDADGRILRHFGTLHDITDRLRAEDEARQMQERLTHFGRISTMGEMAAGIAHEINQPLTAIATYAQACQRILKTHCADESAEHIGDLTQGLQQIENQALRAGEVIRRLRSFVRNREVRREPVDPNQLLEDLLMLAQTDTRHHSVHIRLERGANLPQVQADPVQMQQVILNLVRNGIDAMLELPHERRLLILRTHCNAAGDVEFTVCDHGPGLTDDAKDELFNPFFTTKPTGTGLGLAISQSIIRAHGGKVWYRPNPDGGACFCFSLPAAVKGGAA
jgi:two-component system sensor kinase FixL